MNEYSNHLGNVLEVVTDRKLQMETAPSSGVLDYYVADVVSQSDYYPFGMLMPNTSDEPDEASYRYAFNGMEKDDEIKDIEGSDYGAHFRQYDSRVARWLSVDPKAVSMPWQSPYTSMNDSPILFSDALGDSSVVDNKGNMVHYDINDQDLRVFQQTGDDLIHIGELGGDIDADGFFNEVLADHGARAASENFTMMDWVGLVKGEGDWDLKSNKETIWGVAWAYDELNKEDNDSYTSFSTTRFKFEDASDVGNFHAGWTGTLAGIPQWLQIEGAGLIEQKKDIENGEWDQVYDQFVMPYSNDEPDDYHWNTLGMKTAAEIIEVVDIPIESFLLRAHKIKPKYIPGHPEKSFIHYRWNE